MSPHDHADHGPGAHDHAGHAHAGLGHGAHAPDTFGRAFALGVGFNVAFVAVEAVVGLRADSLALLSDAGHNLSDVLGLLVAWGAIVLGRRRPSAQRTYGWRRSSILAALFNAVFLLVAVGALAWEAVQRFADPPAVAGASVVWVALVGIAVNTGTALLFARGRKGDLNVRGAYLHMAADAAVSAAVVVSGLVILATGWRWVDPAMSLLVAIVIVVSTWGLLRGALNLALDAVPEGIDLPAVDAYLTGLAGHHRRASPARLGPLDDRNRPHRPPRQARPGGRRRASAAGHARAPRALRHRPLYPPVGTVRCPRRPGRLRALTPTVCPTLPSGPTRPGRSGLRGASSPR